MQRCSGRLCVIYEDCLHYLETKKPPRKGKWINPDACKDVYKVVDNKVVSKPEHDQFLPKDSK